jgi:hypothetical protein
MAISSMISRVTPVMSSGGSVRSIQALSMAFTVCQSSPHRSATCLIGSTRHSLATSSAIRRVTCDRGSSHSPAPPAEGRTSDRPPGTARGTVARARQGWADLGSPAPPHRDTGTGASRSPSSDIGRPDDPARSRPPEDQNHPPHGPPPIQAHSPSIPPTHRYTAPKTPAVL